MADAELSGIGSWLFFEAGPLLTPGFRPVCVFGELEPLVLPVPDDCAPDDWRDDAAEVTDDKGDDDAAYEEVAENDDGPVAPCDGDERVLLMVSLMPSEDGFTMYSLLLLLLTNEDNDDDDDDADAAAASLLPSAPADASGGSSPPCCADFSLSMTALSELLRCLAAAAAAATAAAA